MRTLQLLHSLIDGLDRGVPQLGARTRDVDRALLRREPEGEPRDRWLTWQRQDPPRSLAGDGERADHGARRALGAQPDAPGGQPPPEELAAGDRLAVGDEVPPARCALRRAAPQALDDVVDVRGRRAMAATADPRPAPAVRRGAHAGQDR